MDKMCMCATPSTICQRALSCACGGKIHLYIPRERNGTQKKCRCGRKISLECALSCGSTKCGYCQQEYTSRGVRGHEPHCGKKYLP